MSELADISKSSFGSVLPLKKLCCFCLIVLGGRRQGQVLPLAGCAVCLTEQCEGPGLSYSRASQVDQKKEIHSGGERGIFNPLGR